MRFGFWCALVLLSWSLAGTGCRMCASHDDYTYPVRECGSTCGDDCDSCGSCASGGCSSGRCGSACGGGYYENCGHVRSGSAQGGFVDSGPTPAEYVEGETYEVSSRPGKKTR
jgi:hypothetical protein